MKHQLLTCCLPLIDGAARGILIRRAWSPKEASSGAPRRHVARLARTARRREGPRGAMAAELRGGASRWRAGTRALHPHSRRRLPASRMRTAPCWWAGGGGCPRGAQPRARVEAAAAGPVPQRHVAGGGRAGCCVSAIARGCKPVAPSSRAREGA